MQADFEHLGEAVLASPGYLEAILQVIDNKAGVREDDEKRRAFKAIMSENNKRKDETLAQYAVRRQREFNRAADFGVSIPGELRASMLREGALLSEQNMQNLSTLVGNNEHDPEAISRALGRMDVRADRLVGYVAEESHSYVEVGQEDLSESDEEDDEAVLAELDNMSLYEDQIHEVFAVLGARKRTWKENKIYKANLKKDRGSFTKTEAGSTAPRAPQGGFPGSNFRKDKKAKLNRDQLKKVTRCRRCHKKGHWAEDCSMPPPTGSSGGPKMTGFVYSGSSNTGPTSAFTYAVGLPLSECSNYLEQPMEKQSVQVKLVQPASSFLSLTSGDAIVDIGATQDLIGRVAFEAMKYQLALVGLQPVMVDVPVAVPLGIGGAAKVRGVALVPVSPGGIPGVLEFTILESEVPPLLSVGFLEYLGAEISLVTNLIRFTKIEVELLMNRLSTGHRTISLIHWRPEDGSFPVPDELKSKFGLKNGAFDLNRNTPSEYMKGSSGFTSSPSTLWMSPNSEREVASNQTSEFSKIHEPNDSAGVAVEHISSVHSSQQSSISSSSSTTSSFPESAETPSDVQSCTCQREESLQLESKNDVATFGSERTAEYLMGATNTRTVQKFDQSTPLSHGIHQHAHEGKVARTAVQGLFLTLETSRLMFLRLIRTEGKKASNRLRYVEPTSSALDTCLHPSSRRMKRGNQYASWTLCGVCGNRLSYTPKSIQPKSKAKAKPKAYPSIPLTTTSVDREVEEMLEVLEPSCATRTSLPERPASRATSSADLRPFTEEMKMLSTFMQNMMTGMAQQNAQLSQMMGNLGCSIESMANNQSRMLLMMSTRATWRAATYPLWSNCSSKPNRQKVRWKKTRPLTGA